MSPQNLAALLRRHFVAVAFVLVLAAGLGYYVKHAIRGYTDTATAAFIAPPSRGLFSSGNSLLVIDELTAKTAMSASGQRQVLNAGGKASYDVVLINLNNQDYPNYGVPYVTVTTTSADAGTAARTMSAVLKVLQQDASSLQAGQGAKPDTWIRVRAIANPTGPIAQTGSRKRALAGLAILALIAAYLIARFLDRRPVKLRDLRRPTRTLEAATVLRGRSLSQRSGFWIRPSLRRR